jgi:putative addiction module killer protein
MVEIELLFYVEAQGGAPFEAWFRDLDVKAQGKVTVALGRLKNGGAAKVAGVGDGVFEFKLDWGPGYRLYFGRDGEQIILLLCGGTKKRRGHDIAKAKRF